MEKKNSIKKVLKWLFSGFSFFFIAMLFFMVVHDAMTGESSTTAEYCANMEFWFHLLVGEKLEHVY